MRDRYPFAQIIRPRLRAVPLRIAALDLDRVDILVADGRRAGLARCLVLALVLLLAALLRLVLPPKHGQVHALRDGRVKVDIIASTPQGVPPWVLGDVLEFEDLWGQGPVGDGEGGDGGGATASSLGNSAGAW